MEIPTIDEIKLQLKNGIISRHPLVRKFTAGSMLDILDEVVAIQAYNLYNRIDNSTQSISILTATEDYLDALVVDRLPAGRQLGSQATGNITFKRNTAAEEIIPISIGSKARAIGQDGSKIDFETTVYGEIGIGEYSVVIAAHAMTAGEEGNVSEYSITQLPYNIFGIERVENAAAFTGGTNSETDDELRNRYYYAVLVPGKATTEIIEEHLTDLDDVSESHIYTRGTGDIEVVVDYDDGIGEDSSEIIDVLETNIAAGITCCGVLGANISHGLNELELNESSGGRIWVRATENILTAESITIEYEDIINRIRHATADIPAGTITGDAILATLEASTDRVKSITNIIYEGTKSYNVLVGMGQYPYLYTLPREVLVDVTIQITKTTTPENDLTGIIETSIYNFLTSYNIGKDLEWSDLFFYIYTDYETARVFSGIDIILSCTISGNSTTITVPGEIINIEEDQRIRPGAISVTST